MTDKEALKLALGALECKDGWGSSIRSQKEKAITAIKQALAAPVQQEPVAWKNENADPTWPVDLYDHPCPSCGKQLQIAKGGGEKCSCGYWFCF
jgi:hypothetical protein